MERTNTARISLLLFQPCDAFAFYLFLFFLVTDRRSDSAYHSVSEHVSKYLRWNLSIEIGGPRRVGTRRPETLHREALLSIFMFAARWSLRKESGRAARHACTRGAYVKAFSSRICLRYHNVMRWGRCLSKKLAGVAPIHRCIRAIAWTLFFQTSGRGKCKQTRGSNERAAGKSSMTPALSELSAYFQEEKKKGDRRWRLPLMVLHADTDIWLPHIVPNFFSGTTW